MTFTEYKTKLTTATSLETIADIVAKLETDGKVTNTEATKLADIAVERILDPEVLS